MDSSGPPKPINAFVLVNVFIASIFATSVSNSKIKVSTPCKLYI